MARKELLWIALLALLFCGTARAAGHPLDGEFQKCLDVDSSTAGAVECSGGFLKNGTR